MTIKYLNMYMLRKSIQWLVDEPHVKYECGPYVIKEGVILRDHATLTLG